MSVAELKARSRLALHRKMSRPASFYRYAHSRDPITVDVRTFYAGKRVGDLAGTNLSYAEQIEHPTELVFWNDDIFDELETESVDRGARIVFTATEGYYVDVVHPKDGLTQKVEVTPMSESYLAGLVLPDGSVIGA